MARKDINIHIRAKDDASRNAKKAADALLQLAEDGKKAAHTASATGRAFADMQAGMAKLDMGGLRDFGKVVSQLDKAKVSVQRFGDEYAKNTKSFDRANAALQQSTKATADLTAKYNAENQAQVARQRSLDLTTDKLKEQRDALKEVARLERALGSERKVTSRKGIGVEAGAPVSSARASFAAFLNPEISGARNTEAQLKGAIDSIRADLAAGKVAIKDYGTELREAEISQRAMARSVEQAGNAVLLTRADLRSAQQNLASLETTATGASASLGGLAATQDAVTNATRKAAAQLVAMKARVAELNGRPAVATVQPTQDGGNRRDQITNLRDLTQEYAKVRVEAQALGRAMAQAEQPTGDLGAAFGKARAQAAQLKQAINDQRAALRQRGSFSAIGRADDGAKAAAAAAAAEIELANIQKIADAERRAATSKRDMAAAGDKATASLSRMGNASRTTLGFMQRLRGEVLAVTTSFIGFYAAFERGKAAIQSFQAVETAQARLSVAFAGDMAKVNKEIGWLNTQADKLGYTFESLAGGYGKISVAASSAGFSIAETRDLFDSLSTAARVNNTSLDEMNGVLRAVEQMLSKGKVQAQELRGQLGDRMTAAFKTFSTALGMTTEELDEALKKGEVYASRETMLKFAARLNKMYGSQLPKSMQTLSYSIGTFQRDTEKANLSLARGLVPGLQSALKSLHDFSNSVGGQDLFVSLGNGAGKLIAVLAKIPKYFDIIVLAAKGFIAIKLAKLVSSTVAAFSNASAGFAAYARGMQIAARQGQQFNVVQRTLSLGILNTTRAMSVYEARLRASASASVVARAGTLGLAGTVGLLRTVMLGTAAVARTMWAAVGGPVGIAVAAITLGISAWSGRTDDATVALQEHERQLAAVKAAYDGVADKSGAWSKNVQGVTTAQAAANLDKLRDAYGKATRELASYARQAKAGYADIINLVPSDPRAVQALDLTEMAKQFDAGNLSLDVFEKRLNDIANNPADDQIKQLALEMLDMLNTAKDGEQSLRGLDDSIKKSEANLRVMNNTATQADKALLGMGGAVAATTKAFDNSEFVKTYTAAIEDLKSQIPSLADEMKRLKDMTELNTTAWKGLVAAWNAGDYSKIIDIAGLWGRGQAEMAQASQNKRLDAYGGGNSDVVNRIIYVEGGRNGGGPSTSSARGVGQFTGRTWLAYIDRLYPELQDLNRTQKLALRSGEENRDIQMKVMNTFTRDNQGRLLNAGVNAGAKETYLAHFLGAGDAIKVLLANPQDLAENIVNPKSVAANPAVFKDGMTIADLINWSVHKMGDGSAVTSTGQTENEKKRQDEEKSTQQRIADLDHQIAQQKLINYGKEREAAIEDAIRQAKAENSNLTDQELAKIREQTGALWDQQNIHKQRELTEERINQLYELRQQLMEQRQMAIEQGDTTKADALKTQIESTNLQLDESIPKLIAMWQAVGGPEADAAIAKLQTMQMSIKANKDQMGLFGMTMQQWQSVFDTMVGGLVNAFDTMAQAIAQGENAFLAFGRGVLTVLADVLKQIALTIIRMQILKAMQSFGGPIGTFASAAIGSGGMTGHTGGLVGSKAIGSGNAIRPSGWVANAFAGAYHSGGIAGLRADEVSATLRKNEEVLTTEDPRHRFNQGGERKEKKSDRLTQVLAIGDKQAEEMIAKYGSKAILTTIKSNAATIRSMLG